jgi:MerR family transcriptional regulator, copper efflux regulator
MDAWYNHTFSIADKLVLGEKLLSIEAKIKQLEEMKRLVSEFKESVETESC